MTDKKLSRRQFLKMAGLTLAASTVTCSGLGYAATRTPAFESPAISFGKEDAMNTRILVAYATRAGSTVEVASAIGEALGQRGFAVDVSPIKAKPALQGYQAVILGSAIRMGSWLPEAVDFIKANQATLKAMPVALFTVHMLNTGDDAASVAARQAYLQAVRPLLNPAEEVYFAGKMDFAQLSFLDRLVSKMVKSVEADRRDWDTIRSWTPAMLA